MDNTELATEFAEADLGVGQTFHWKTDYGEVIPDEISNLRYATKIKVFRKRLTGFSSYVWAVPGLEILDLEDNQIRKIPAARMNQARELRKLSLMRNPIGSLPKAIGKLRNLRSLDLTETDLCELPESIGDLKLLQSLDLCGCEQLKTLPASMGQLENLTYLSLVNTGVEYLPDEICNLRRLEVLDLKVSQLKALPERLGDIKTLGRLDINGTKVQELPASMSQLVNLKILNLQGTKVRKWFNLDDLNRLTNVNYKFTSPELNRSILHYRKLYGHNYTWDSHYQEQGWTRENGEWIPPENWLD